MPGSTLTVRSEAGDHRQRGPSWSTRVHVGTNGNAVEKERTLQRISKDKKKKKKKPAHFLWKYPAFLLGFKMISLFLSSIQRTECRLGEVGDVSDRR